MSEIIQSVWKGMLLNTSEFLMLTPSNDSFYVRSFITGEAEGSPLHIEYRIIINNSWIVQSLFIDLINGGQHQVGFTRSVSGVWKTVAGENLPDLNECTDPDISYTPFTNTLAIKRLNLQVGEQSEIIALFFDLPSLMPKPMRQRYTRKGEKQYLYENVDSDFQALLNIDDNALVIDYADRWKRIFPAND